MFALVDCNNFYVSCERLFRPELRDKPVVVLSNNDGCVISRSDEAKTLGISMTAPWFSIQDIVKTHQVTAFSSNYTLYADMSARVMTNLARFTPHVEVYSIDECFLGLNDFKYKDLDSYGKEIRETVVRNTGIPISIGIAPSKTLAKLANRLAKRAQVHVLDTAEKISSAVNEFPVQDIWGIGRAYARKLNSAGILTAGDFRNKPLERVRKNFTIQGVRLWYELWGRSCLPLSQSSDRRKAVCTSRQFGKLTDNYKDIEEAAAVYTTRLAEKLREDNSCASLLSVRLATNPNRKELPQYFKTITIPLPYPLNNTPDLVKYALFGLKKIYTAGYKFSKVEVTASGLVPEQEIQLNLFHSDPGLKKNKLSKLMDKLNKYYGRGTLRTAAEGFEQPWAMRRNYLSPAYTTNWND